jgi:hypothetical protein
MFTIAVFFLIGAAFSFAVTRIANKLNGTDTLKADYAWLKDEYAKLLAKFNSQTPTASA